MPLITIALGPVSSCIINLNPLYVSNSVFVGVDNKANIWDGVNLSISILSNISPICLSWALNFLIRFISFCNIGLTIFSTRFISSAIALYLAIFSLISAGILGNDSNIDTIRSNIVNILVIVSIIFFISVTFFSILSNTRTASALLFLADVRKDKLFDLLANVMYALVWFTIFFNFLLLQLKLLLPSLIKIPI